MIKNRLVNILKITPHSQRFSQTELNKKTVQTDTYKKLKDQNTIIYYNPPFCEDQNGTMFMDPIIKHNSSHNIKYSSPIVFPIMHVFQRQMKWHVHFGISSLSDRALFNLESCKSFAEQRRNGWVSTLTRMAFLKGIKCHKKLLYDDLLKLYYWANCIITSQLYHYNLD